MDLRLKGKRVLVAGSSRGLGKWIAETFLKEGAVVAVSGRDGKTLAATAREFERRYGKRRVLAVKADFSKKANAVAAVKAMARKWGGIDVLIANAGSGSGKRGWDLSEKDWSDLFKINFWSAVRAIEATLPLMVEQKSGAIVVISSIAGVEAIPAPLPYSTAKAALITYTKNLAHDLGPKGIRVNSVAPGNIFFPGGIWDQKLREKGPAVRQYINDSVPLRKFGTPEEIAALTVFLSSNRASFITGSCMVADGGQTKSF